MIGEWTNRKNSRSVLGSERSGVSSKNTGQQETKVLLLSTFASAFFSVHHTIWKRLKKTERKTKANQIRVTHWHAPSNNSRNSQDHRGSPCKVSWMVCHHTNNKLHNIKKWQQLYKHLKTLLPSSNLENTFVQTQGAYFGHFISHTNWWLHQGQFRIQYLGQGHLVMLWATVGPLSTHSSKLAFCTARVA